MKRITSSIVMVLLAIAAMAQTQNTSSEIETLEKNLFDISEKVEYMEENMNNTLVENYQLKVIQDSLEKELVHYQVKEDYYSAALADQATRFASIVAILIFIIGLGTYFSITSEINKVKIYFEKRDKKHFNTIKKIKIDFNELEIKALKTDRNLRVTLGENFYNQTKYHKAMSSYILASEALHNYNKLKNDIEGKLVLQNSLNEALKCALKTDKNQCDLSNVKTKRLKNIILKIQNDDLAEAYDICLKILIQLNRIEKVIGF